MSDATVTATAKPKRSTKTADKKAPAKKAAVKKAAPKKAAPKAAEEKTAPKRAPKPKAVLNSPIQAEVAVDQKVADAAMQRANDAIAKADEAVKKLTDATVEATKQTKKFAAATMTANEAAQAFEAAAPRAAAAVEPPEPPIKGSHAIQRAPLHRPARLRYDARPAHTYWPSETFPYGGFAAKTMSKKEVFCLNAMCEIRYLKRSMADQLLALR